MSLKSHEARKLAVASLAALAALGAGASSAQANATLSLDYTCTYPLIGPQGLHIDIDAAIPDTVVQNVTTPAFQIAVKATATPETWDGIDIIGAKSIEGTSDARASIALPGGFNLPVKVPITVNKYTVPTKRGPLLLTAQGSTPPLTFPQPGTAPITLNSISLNLIARDGAGAPLALPPVTTDSDGDPDTFDVACVLNPASQSTLLSTITITPQGGGGDTTAPTAPGTPSASGITTTGATVSWGASTDAVGVTGYDVYVNGALKTSTTGATSAALTGLTAGTTYAVTVKAKDAAGNVSAASAAGSLTTTGTGDIVAPTKPGTPVASAITSSGATLTWTASTDAVGVVGYDVYNGATKLTSSATPSATVSGLSALTSYSLTVKARDAAGNTSVASSPVAFTTISGPVQPPVLYGYNAAGTATLKTLVKGTLPLKGTIDARLTLATGAFDADLVLARTSGNLTALGFLPVAASVDIVPTAPVTGTLKSGVLNANAKVRIKLPRVTLAGIQLAGGSGCQTKQISSINLRSTDAFFAPLSGGTLAGTFSISELVNCGFLTGIVSPLTQGSGNAIALKLTPKA